MKINSYVISGSECGFSVWLMALGYTSIPKIIIRNINYFILDEIKDNVSLDRITKNNNLFDKEGMKKAYYQCIKKTFNFSLLDLKAKDPQDSCGLGWLNFLKLKGEGN